jgi:hypothetical protein
LAERLVAAGAKGICDLNAEFGEAGKGAGRRVP